LELLKQIAPGVTRAAGLRDLAAPDGIGQFAAMQLTIIPDFAERYIRRLLFEGLTAHRRRRR
jgi:hypothetical protein